MTYPPFIICLANFNKERINFLYIFLFHSLALLME